jgi:alpha-1,3/alpha-1,6-mannosyltransferase
MNGAEGGNGASARDAMNEADNRNGPGPTRAKNHARRIAFVHPDLGIGGAERLVLDAALALKATGHEVRVFAATLDRRRCFQEVRDGRVDVRVHGGRLPVSIGGRLRAPCNVLRTGVAALAALRWSPDLVFCDLLAHLVPLLRLGRAPVLFYGHFPDCLLTGQRTGWYRLYRRPIDALEFWGTGLASRLVVNSRFTSEAYIEAFPSVALRRVVVLPPSVSCSAKATPLAIGDDGPLVVASINRFDPAKNLDLAVRALAALRTRIDAATFGRIRLVMAGGLDPRLPEQVRTFEELGALAASLGLADQVELRPSINDAERAELLASCRVVLYTPEREHFGIVPLEAMAAARPVIAARSGGPRETVLDGVTGLLRDATADAFADALASVLTDPEAARRMGIAARERAEREFSAETFRSRLDSIVREMTGSR